MKGNKSKLDYLKERYSGVPKASKSFKTAPEIAQTRHDFDDEPAVFNNDPDFPVVVEDPEGLLKASKRSFSQSKWITLEDPNSNADVEPPRKKRHDSDSEDETPRPVQNPAVETFKIDATGDMEPPRPRGKKLNNEVIEEVSGQEPLGTVYREKGGRIISKETARTSKREQLEKLNAEQLNKWGKGTKQLQEEQERAAFEERVAKQPLRNTEVSKEIDEELKNATRFGDPMKDLIEQGKRRKEGMLIFASEFKAPPNRYEIQPGHRWDGVDRGNGFEKKLLLTRNERRANEAEAYKWRTEDM